MGIDGAVVLVAGATGQVGWGVARAAREAGAALILPASRPASGERLADDFPDAQVVVVDLLEASAGDVVADAVDAHGARLDHVVAPIGSWWQQGPTLEQPTAELTTLLDTYVIAQHRLLRATSPFLADAGGSYTLVTGAAGERPIPGAGMLVTAVRAQWALCDVLRAELAEAPFRFNEMRIRTRIEREPRAGVVPSRTAGDAFVDVMAGHRRSERLLYPS